MKKRKKINTKKIKSSIIKYIYSNRLFISYVIISLIGTIILRNITIGNIFDIRPLITDLGIILLLGSLGYLCKPKNQFKYFFALIIFFSVLEVINSVYYTFYTSFASLSEFSTLGQAETVTDAIFIMLKIEDFIYLINPFIFYYIHHNLKRSPYYSYISKVEIKKKMIVGTLFAGLLFVAFSFGISSSADRSRLTKQWNRKLVVERFGILMYQVNDVYATIKPKISKLFGYETAYQKFTDYFENEERDIYFENNKYSGILKGYNIVYIHMESIQNFLMDLEFNGLEVTPNINKLAKEGMFFNNFYSPVSTGTSSDAEYMMLTGLLPSSSGTVFVSYPNNKFNTIAHYLKEKEYYTFSMHGNYASMWNRNKIHPNLGYDNMFFRNTYEFTDEDVIGLGINDKLFFRKSLERLETIELENKNYFGTMITLTNHSSFEPHPSFTYDINTYSTDKDGNEVSNCFLCDRVLGRYIVSSHYADEAIGEFIEYVKSSDKFNKTLFVFYGDHDAKISYHDMNYLYNHNSVNGEYIDDENKNHQEYDSFDHNLNKKVPLIFWTKNNKLKNKLKGTIDYTMAMYDVAPTLYNMLGIENKYVIGHDIFNIKDDNIVIFPNANYITNKIYYNNSTNEYKLINKNDIVDTEYINEKLEYAEKSLEVGNAIINYDLFNPKKSKEAKNTDN